MDASMRVAGWADLEYSSDVVISLVERLSPRSDVARLRASLDDAPIVPSGLAHHGVGGDELGVELARLLASPNLERVVTVAFVPFAVGEHVHSEGEHEHAIVEAERLRERWPGSHDAVVQAAVLDARRAVARGAPSAEQHQRWLEHFLVEKLLPVGASLALPVVITWSSRRGVPETAEAISARLDRALASWDE